MNVRNPEAPKLENAKIWMQIWPNVSSILQSYSASLDHFNYNFSYCKLSWLASHQTDTPRLHETGSYSYQFFVFLGRLDYLDKLPWDDLQLQLAIGLLAGNVFDWGAKEVALLMEESSLVRISIRNTIHVM